MIKSVIVSNLVYSSDYLGRDIVSNKSFGICISLQNSQNTFTKSLAKAMEINPIAFNLSSGKLKQSTVTTVQVHLICLGE